MPDLNADIVLCEDGRDVVAYVHRGDDEFVGLFPLGRMAQRVIEATFDEDAWRPACIQLLESIAAGDHLNTRCRREVCLLPLVAALSAPGTFHGAQS